MEKTEKDKRYQKSKSAIEEAIHKLYEAGKNLSQITVSEITNLANITRKTFYLHYQNVNDFLTEQAIESADGYAKAYLNPSMPLISATQDLFKGITKSYFSNSFLWLLQKSKYHQAVFYDRITLNLKNHIRLYSTLNDYALEFISGGLTSTFQLWLRSLKGGKYQPEYDNQIKTMVEQAFSFIDNYK